MRPRGAKAAARKHQTKSARKSAASPVQRKYSSIYMSRTTPTSTAKKSVPPAIQLARAIKCLDVFGKHDPDAASFYAQRKYDDADMAREFKALSATNPAAGGYLIPEIYLDQIIELLYSKTVIFELGAQKVPHGQRQPEHPQDDRRAPALPGAVRLARLRRPSPPTATSVCPQSAWRPSCLRPASC